jgi:transcription initiation factor IIE alpha subunit
VVRVDTVEEKRMSDELADCRREVERLRALLAEEAGWRIEYERVSGQLREAYAEIARLSALIGKMGDR